MNAFVRACYYIFRGACKGYMRLFNEMKVWGAENIPEGPKIFCSNHFASADPFIAFTLVKEPIHMMIGAAYRVVPRILDAAEQINTLPEHRKTAVAKAVKYLKRGESVYIFPEGQLNDQITFRHFYTGVARIYRAYPVPIVPIGLVSPRKSISYTQTDDSEYLALDSMFLLFKKYFVNFGAPMRFPKYEKMKDAKKAEEAIMRTVKARVQFLVDDIKTNKFWS